MTDDQLEEILALWKAGRFYQAGTHASDLVEALRSAWVTNARLKDHAAYLNLERAEAQALLAALKQEHQPADSLRSQLLAEMEAHAETKAELAEAVRVGDERLATLWDEKKAEINRLQTQLDGNGMILTAISMIVGDRPGLVEAVQQLKAELAASNATIDMLYERSGRFAAQADKYEQELKVAKAAILQVQSRLDDALALLSAKSAQLETVLAKRLELGGALEAADQKIDELQERSAGFEAERHNDQLRLKSAEDEIKAAKEEKAEAIRLGDERLAELWDMKQKEIQSLKAAAIETQELRQKCVWYSNKLVQAEAEITRLRRHLGEIE